jgi:hypothetical protein
MIQELNNIDLITLLNLESITEDEKKEMLDLVSETVIAEALNRLVDGPMIDEVQKEEVTKFIDDNIINENFDKLVLEKYPEFARYIDEEAYLFKKNALIEQLNEIVNSTNNDADFEGETMYVAAVDLLKIIEADDNNMFLPAWVNFSSYLVEDGK